MPIPTPPKIKEITMRTTPFTTVFFPPLESQSVAHFIMPIIESITPIPKQIITRKAKALLKIVPILFGMSFNLSVISSNKRIFNNLVG